MTRESEMSAIVFSPQQPRVAVLLSQHQKTELLSVLTEQAGLQVQTDAAFDTDSLGSFSRAVARDGDQQQAALRKAQLACQRNQQRFGLGSEGSFGPDPRYPWLCQGLELITLWDATTRRAITGRAQGPSPYRSQRCQSWAEVVAFARQVGFPEQWLQLTAGAAEPGAATYNGIRDWMQLQQLADACLQTAAALWLETDYRAHACPGRRPLIAAAAADLARRLRTCCPQCQAADFSISAIIPGAACAACGLPTSQPRQRIRSCHCCGYQQTEELVALAEPQHCPQCNP